MVDTRSSGRKTRSQAISTPKSTTTKHAPKKPAPKPKDGADADDEGESNGIEWGIFDDPTAIRAPLPYGAVKVPFEYRDANWPILYTIPNHPLITDCKGTIYLAYSDWRKPAMSKLLRFAALMDPPRTAEQARRQGMDCELISD